MTPEITITEDQNSPPKQRIFTVDFLNTDITVTVTPRPSVVRNWLRTTMFLRNQRHLRGRHVVGLAVQWNPSNGNDPPADTLQLCVGCRCLIFQLAHSATVPRLLRRFLTDAENTFVGIWNFADEKKLMMKHGLVINNLIDLRRHVVDDDGERLNRATFGRIVKECLGFEGVELEFDVSMSDWDDYYLSDEQVLQACVKAYVAFEIGKDLRAWQI